MTTRKITDDLLVQTAYAGGNYVELSQTKNDIGIKCDDNYIIQNGIFQGYTLDSNICQGNQTFKQKEQLIQTIHIIYILFFCLYSFYVTALAKTNRAAVNIAMHFGILLLLAFGLWACTSLSRRIKYKKILDTGIEYKGILYDVRRRTNGKASFKECYFAIWDNGRVRIVKEFILHQPFNRISAIKKDKALVGQEFTVIASPDETGYCIRKR